MSINCLKLFGSANDLTSIPLYSTTKDKGSFLLSRNYPKIVISREFKNEFDAYVDTKTESDTSLFRKMIRNLIPSDDVSALRDKDRMKTDFNDEIHAAFGYVSEKRPFLNFGAAEGEFRKLCNAARRRLRCRGYNIVKNDEKKNPELGAYKGDKNPNNSNEHNWEDDSTCLEQVSFNNSNDGESTNDLLIEKVKV
ncbi:unnamed protein product [Brachionus calyciflorus]|uniref:Uncharacterized protein n=1 Tax=Brachionus calyciflorus TaxID=104777 RepID=A0A813WUY6_9BILA|nr:unnamed protein product [Brachionus calyciflorus]